MRGLFKRRRQQQKTDYTARLAMLKSGQARLVVRRTNRYVIAQVVSSDKAQDTVIVTANSKDLIAKGWPADKEGSLKNREAAYLTGFMVAKMAIAKGTKKAVLDLGMQRNVKKSRLYSALKGAVDAGLAVPHSEEAFPDKDMLEGDMIKKIKDKL